MRLRLLKPHFIDGQLMEAGRLVENVTATPDMEGLDDDGVAAVAAEMMRVYARYPGVPHGFPTYGASPLDAPPIRRPLDDNQPEFHFVGCTEYIS